MGSWLSKGIFASVDKSPENKSAFFKRSGSIYVCKKEVKPRFCLAKSGVLAKTASSYNVCGRIFFKVRP
jgi:hypothetical protein